MKISLLSSGPDLVTETREVLDKDSFLQLSNILDHAVLRKFDVEYSQKEGYLTLNLDRNKYEDKKIRFLWFNVWIAGKYPTNKCVLTIKDIEKCDIRDDDQKTTEKQEVIIGGITFNNGSIFIGSFCEYDNAYSITLKAKRINISLEDRE